MNTRPVLELVDAGCPDRRAEWERAFYQGFARATSNRLIRTLWLWNEAEARLATRIPYGDQLIYLSRDAGGAINSGVAVNVGMRHFQASAFGFAPAAGGPPACEILVAFNLHGAAPNLHWRDLAFADLHARGYRRAYLTAADRVHRLWRRYGAEVLAETLVDGERRWFLGFALGPSGMAGAANL
ncbi:MAG: hypothetical protein ACKOET_04440 [Verrucomicrobiota bacterium]